MTIEEKMDCRLAVIVLMVVFLLGLAVGKCWASDDMNSNCHKSNLQGIKGGCFEDITKTEILEYLRKLEALRKLTCSDIMPVVWQKYPESYKDACDEKTTSN